MKIVLLQDDFPPESKGGAGNMVATLALALKAAGHDIVVIAATQDSGMAGVGEWEGIEVHRIYSNYHERWRAYRSLYNWSTVPKVRQLLQQLRPDVVHAHNVHYHLSYYCLVLAKRYAKKVVLTAHDVMLFHYGSFYEFVDTKKYRVRWSALARRFKRRWNPLRGPLISYCIRGVPIVAISHEHARALMENGYRSTVVYNGIDPAGWPASKETVDDFRARHALRDKKIVLFVGGISNRLKGIKETFGAMNLVTQHIPDALLLVAGAAGEWGEGVRCVGRLDAQDMKAAYGASDVVLFPSIGFDVFGLVNLEAMAAGKPVVATCFGGASEIVVDGETGYVVDPRDTEQFAARVSELLRDPAKTTRIGAAGRARLLARFTADRMADEYLRQYSAETS